MRVDCKKIAQIGGTLCIYMGMGQLSRIVGQLIEGGKSPETPVAVVQWATLPRQRSVFGILSNIESLVGEAGLSSPAVIIIGETVDLHKSVSWFDKS